MQEVTKVVSLVKNGTKMYHIYIHIKNMAYRNYLLKAATAVTITVPLLCLGLKKNGMNL